MTSDKHSLRADEGFIMPDDVLPKETEDRGLAKRPAEQRREFEQVHYTVYSTFGALNRKSEGARQP